jgi:hypothetical protein
MKAAAEHRTYEERDAEWILFEPAGRPPALIVKLAQFAATVLAIAAIAVIGIVATIVGLVLLPLGLLASRRLARSPRGKQGNHDEA